MGILFPVLRAKSSKNDVLLNRHFSIKVYELATNIRTIQLDEREDFMTINQGSTRLLCLLFPPIAPIKAFLKSN